MIPEGSEFKLAGLGEVPATLALFPRETSDSGFAFVSTSKTAAYVAGLPVRFREDGIDYEGLRAYFREHYPTLADFDRMEPELELILIDAADWDSAVVLEWTVGHTWSAAARARELLSKGMPYPHDGGTRAAWVPPQLDGGGTLHPLLMWWSVLYSLSMLARYQPDRWLRCLRLDASADAVAIERMLDAALEVCPEIVLNAIREVSEGGSSSHDAPKSD